MKRDLSGRVHLIDEVRGLAILLMVVYHTFYDLVMIFGLRIDAFFSTTVNLLVILFAGLFIFISGTACHYSRNNLKRGAVCFALGLVFTAGTALIMPEELILFGILHLLGCCMMLFPLLAPLIRRIPPLVGIMGSLLLFLLLFPVSDGFVGIPGLFSIPLPRALYDVQWLFWLGFPSPSFFSADYFPLLPWFFCFTAGTFFGVLVKEKRLPNWVYSRHCPPLAFIGRHTLIIYLLHQPIVYGILWLIFTCIA